jgi:hypothetical protein
MAVYEIIAACFLFFLFLDEKKQKSRAAEKKAKDLSTRVK